jgi:predicted small lipoprotein YifL
MDVLNHEGRVLRIPKEGLMANTKKTVPTAVLLVALSGALSACGGIGGTSVPSATVTAPTAASKSATAVADDSTILAALTGTVKWNNGVSMKLGGFQRGTSSAYASPSSTPYLGFTVTLANGSKSLLDTSMVSLTCPNGGSEVFDTDSGLGGAPGGHLLPGKTQTWKTACEFKVSAKDVQIEVTPGTMDQSWYRTGIFTGTVK